MCWESVCLVGVLHSSSSSWFVGGVCYSSFKFISGGSPSFIQVHIKLGVVGGVQGRPVSFIQDHIKLWLKSFIQVHTSRCFVGGVGESVLCWWGS